MFDFSEVFPEHLNDREIRSVPPPKRSRSRVGHNSKVASVDPDFLEDCPPLLMATTAWQTMMADLTTRPPEAGGVLIGPVDHDAVTHYVPDSTGRATSASFTFDHMRINEMLRHYVPLGLDAKGVAHSHPYGCFALSGGDLQFVSDCFAKAPQLEFDRFYMPIVVGKRVFPYIVYRRESPVAVFSQLILF